MRGANEAREVKEPAAGTSRLLADLVLSRHSRVSLRRQLVSQLGAAIRSGRVGPGQRLPSARWLGPRLGLHRNTVRLAYSELDRLSLVSRRPGSGVYVPETWSPHGGSLEDAFRGFLDRGRASGLSARQLDDLFSRWTPRGTTPRLCVAEPEPALRSILVAELASALSGVKVLGSSVGRARRVPSGLEGCCLVVRPELVGALRDTDPSLVDVVPIRFAGAGAWCGPVGRLRPGSVLALLSVSRGLRRHARELLAGRLADAIGLICPDPRSPPDVKRALRIADCVLVDVLCAVRLRPASRPRPGSRVHSLRLIAPSWIDEMARYFGAEQRSSPRWAELERARGIG